MSFSLVVLDIWEWKLGAEAVDIISYGRWWNGFGVFLGALNLASQRFDERIDEE